MSESDDVVRDLEASLASSGPLDREALSALLRRAIAEIRALREKLGEGRTEDSIETGELNASNDS